VLCCVSLASSNLFLCWFCCIVRSKRRDNIIRYSGFGLAIAEKFWKSNYIEVVTLNLSTLPFHDKSEKFQGNSVFQGKRKLLKNPE